jgi:hypothetical protein
MKPIEIIVTPQGNEFYQGHDADGGQMLTGVPEVMLDLIPFMVARRLLDWRYDPACLLVVKLRGADFDMMRAPLRVVAATPLLNTAAPVAHPAYNAWTELATS